MRSAKGNIATASIISSVLVGLPMQIMNMTKMPGEIPHTHRHAHAQAHKHTHIYAQNTDTTHSCTYTRTYQILRAKVLRGLQRYKANGTLPHHVH